jgi:hypothetical protein
MGESEHWIEAYPNPTNGRLSLNVHMEPEAGLELTVFDAMGRKVLRQALGEQTFTELDLSSVPSGMYFIQVANGTERELIRVTRE